MVGQNHSSAKYQILARFLLLSAFLIGLAGPPPVQAAGAPVLIAPTNGATTTVQNFPPLGIPEFRWEPVAGATQYRLQVSGDIAFTSPVVNITTPNTAYTPTDAGVFSDRQWFWRVRVESPSVGDWSEIWSFTKQWATDTNRPILLSPADGATLDFYDDPVFSWQPVMGAAKYKFQISSSPDNWTSPAYNVTTLATTHQPPAKLANGTYYWRVVPVDSGNHDGTPSEVRSFTARYNQVPTLLEPADNAEPTFTPTFRWTAVRGAQFYRLQYSTDPTFNTSVTQIDTRNTTYTPRETLPNDVNYYWRVRVHSGNSVSEWSEVRRFVKRWYIQPVLLTPTNNYQHQRFPLFSWTPVPGAARYFVEIDDDPGFGSLYDSGWTANPFFTPNKYLGNSVTFYWRVTPYDGSGKPGKASDTSSYVSYGTSVAPHQIYPLYYYPPNTFPGYSGVEMHPYEDRTVPLPIFMWHRVYKPVGDPDEGNVYGGAYRLQVSTDPTFSTITWQVDTENLVATPTSSNPFTPQAGVDYYWRVRPLASIGGSEIGEWSQVWRTRIDLSRGLTPTTGSAPVLIRPLNGAEFAETTPLLEWFPMSGASEYEVQISRDANFTDIVDSATVPYPAYAPTRSLAQRSLDRLDFGVYYWRVRKAGSSTWSETRRFQIAAQSQWKATRTLGDPVNRLQIGSDPSGDTTDPDYDVTTLQVAQSKDYWYFGFHVPLSPSKNVTYALYLDIDHQDNSGATSDARGYNVTTIAAYRPEYAVYVLQEGGVLTDTRVYLYRWLGSGWGSPEVLRSAGGRLTHSEGYVELEIPNTAIGYQDTTGSYAISLLSLPASSPGTPQDSVPSDPNIPGSGPVSRFASVTERMNLVMPPNNAGIDPTVYPSIQPFFWDWPILAPWSGARIQAHLDPQFTSQVAEYVLTADTAHWAMMSHAWEKDFQGDNTYYWRVQPRYRVDRALYYGAWSQSKPFESWRFERQGFVPENLQTSVTFATPTFSWDMVEGAESYDLQVDNDPGFSSPEINVTTKLNSYTYDTTLRNGTYYWRVRVRRNGGITNDWSPVQTFTLTLPVPTDLHHRPSGVVGHAPTLCWTPLIASSGDVPVLAAWKYRVQVSKDATFTNIFDSVDTEQRCWTPTKGYDDGQYYWRVAMIDGQGRLGDFSTPATFTKQYPVTTLISPTNGALLASTPTFVWTPVNGAARYRLQVSLSSTFATLYDSVETVNTRYTPRKLYESRKTYYWRVAIIDSDGKVGPYTDATIILDPYPYRVYLPLVLKRK